MIGDDHFSKISTTLKHSSTTTNNAAPPIASHHSAISTTFVNVSNPIVGLQALPYAIRNCQSSITPHSYAATRVSPKSSTCRLVRICYPSPPPTPLTVAVVLLLCLETTATEAKQEACHNKVKQNSTQHPTNWPNLNSVYRIPTLDQSLYCSHLDRKKETLTLIRKNSEAIDRLCSGVLCYMCY
ncbi:hypothetical protein SLA2020_130300 [Shorea laevis]